MRTLSLGLLENLKISSRSWPSSRTSAFARHLFWWRDMCKNLTLAEYHSYSFLITSRPIIRKYVISALNCDFMHCCGGGPAGWSKLASEPQMPNHYGRPSVFAFSRSQGFSCLGVKRRSVCVCFPGSVCVCQHRRLSRGDARPPADSQRANYRIIRRERGHMCRVASAPTTHTHTHVTACSC